MHIANYTVWWRKNNGLGLFLMLPFVPVKGNLKATVHNNILVFQLCGNSLWKALSHFSMSMPSCTKRDPYQNALSRLVWKNLTGLRRALTSTPSAGLNRPTSVPDLTNALVAE